MIFGAKQLQLFAITACWCTSLGSHPGGGGWKFVQRASALAACMLYYWGVTEVSPSWPSKKRVIACPPFSVIFQDDAIITLDYSFAF